MIRAIGNNKIHNLVNVKIHNNIQKQQIYETNCKFYANIKDKLYWNVFGNCYENYLDKLSDVHYNRIMKQVERNFRSIK